MGQRDVRVNVVSKILVSDLLPVASVILINEASLITLGMPYPMVRNVTPEM